MISISVYFFTENSTTHTAISVSMTMKGKTKYLTPPLVLKETETKILENFASCIHFYHFFISEKKTKNHGRSVLKISSPE